MTRKAFFISRRSRYGFSLGSAAVVCLMVFSAFLGQRFLSYLDHVKISQEILRSISSISLSLERSEASYRGYVYTLDARMLKRYHVAAVSIQSEIDDLELRLEKNLEQVKTLQSFRATVKKLFAQHDETIKNVKILDRQVIAEQMFLGDLKDAREDLQNLEIEEARLLSELSDEADQFFNRGLAVVIIGMLTGIGLMIWSRRDLGKTAKSAFAQNSILNSVVENLNAGLVVVNADGSVRFSNAEFEKILGFGIDGLSLSNREQLFNCYSPISRQIIPSEGLPLARALKGESVNDMEFIIRTHHSEKDIILNASSRPIYDVNQEIIGAVAIYRDIAKRKKIEEEWSKARELALENARLKSEFLTQLSHEIRTPMNGLIAMSQLLMKSSLSQEQISYAKNIYLSSHYLMNLIQSVSDQSLVEKGTFKLNMAPFKLSECIQHIVTILEPSAENRNIQLFLDSEVESDLEVVCDSIRLQEVLFDAIETAIARTEKGFVSIKVQVLEVYDGKARFYFEIKDSGNATVKPKTETGRSKEILIKEIVRCLDAETENEFIENQGHHYSLTIDMILKVSDEKKIIKRHTQILAEKPILVAEDQAINQMVIRKYLERFGLQCHIVSDGRSAFLEATTGKYSVVLMDCKMQPIDGYEATQLIRTHEKRQGTRIPIIALTADGTTEDRKKCERVGMDDYIVKPIELEKLESTLQKWIQPVIKEEYIKKLDGYQMEGKPLLNVLAEDYFLSTPEFIDKIEMSIANEDLKQVQYFSHTLKSSSITLGLVELSQLCQKLESMTKIDPSTKIILTQIKESYRRSEPVLRKRILSRPI